MARLISTNLVVLLVTVLAASCGDAGDPPTTPDARGGEAGRAISASGGQLASGGFGEPATGGTAGSASTGGSMPVGGAPAGGSAGKVSGGAFSGSEGGAGGRDATGGVGGEGGRTAPADEPIAPPAGCVEKVTPGNLWARSDADLAQLEGVTTIEGSLSISDAVSSLAPLACLTHVDGALSVSASELTEASLPGLMHVSTDVGFGGTKLTRINLPKLVRVGAQYTRSLSLAELPALVSVNIPVLRETPDGIRISNVGATAQQPLELDFAALEVVAGALELAELPTLVNLDGMPELREVRNLVIINNPALVDLDALRTLATVRGRISVSNNRMLTSIDLTSLTTVGAASGYSLYFDQLPALTRLHLDELIEAPDNVVFAVIGETTDEPLSFSAKALTTIGGSMDLSFVANLEDLDGIPSLSLLGGNLTITANFRLSDCAASELRDRLIASGFEGMALVTGNKEPDSMCP